MHALCRAQAAHGTATLIKSLCARVKPTMAPFSMGRLFKAFVGAFVAPCGYCGVSATRKQRADGKCRKWSYNGINTVQGLSLEESKLGRVHPVLDGAACGCRHHTFSTNGAIHLRQRCYHPIPSVQPVMMVSPQPTFTIHYSLRTA